MKKAKTKTKMKKKTQSKTNKGRKLYPRKNPTCLALGTLTIAPIVL